MDIFMGLIAGLFIGVVITSLRYSSILQKLQNRVEYLQDTLNMCNDQDD